MYKIKDLEEITEIFARGIGITYLGGYLNTLSEKNIATLGAVMMEKITKTVLKEGKDTLQLTKVELPLEYKGTIRTHQTIQTCAKEAVEKDGLGNSIARSTMCLLTEDIKKLLAGGTPSQTTKRFFGKGPEEAVEKDELVAFYNHILIKLLQPYLPIILPIHTTTFQEHCLDHLEHPELLRENDKAAMLYVGFATAPEPRTRQLTKLFDPKHTIDCPGCLYLPLEALSTEAHQLQRQEWDVITSNAEQLTNTIKKQKTLEIRLHEGERERKTLNKKIETLQFEIKKRETLPPQEKPADYDEFFNDYETTLQELEKEKLVTAKERERNTRYGITIHNQHERLREQRENIHTLQQELTNIEKTRSLQEETIREAIETMHTYQGKRVVFIGGHPADIQILKQYLEPFGARVEHIIVKTALRMNRPQADLTIYCTGYTNHGVENHLKALGMKAGEDDEPFTGSKATAPAQLVEWAKKHFPNGNGKH